MVDTPPDEQLQVLEQLLARQPAQPGARSEKNPVRLHRDDASTRRIFAATTARTRPPPAVGRFVAHLRAEAGDLSGA